MPATQGPAAAEFYAEAKDVDLAIQPTMPPRATEGEPNSPPLDQTPGGVTGATAPLRADREEGLSETDKVLGVQVSQTDQQKLPRKKKEGEELDAGVTVELEAQPGYIGHQRLPRKKQGNEELEAETLLPHVHQERLPRKKEGEESDGGRSG